MKNLRHLLNFFLPLLVLASYSSLASAVKTGGVEYRKRRSKSATGKIDVASSIADHKNPRQLITANKNKNGLPKKMIRRNSGARGSNTKQSRRELGKSSGKSSSGKSSSGKSGSGGSGSSSHSGPGWNTDDGSYCGCLCMSTYSTSETNNHGLSCDFTVDQNSYGYGKR